MSKTIPLTDLQAARVEVLFHRRRALAMEMAMLERDELAATQGIEAAYGLKPNSYTVDHVAKLISVNR